MFSSCQVVFQFWRESKCSLGPSLFLLICMFALSHSNVYTVWNTCPSVENYGMLKTVLSWWLNDLIQISAKDHHNYSGNSNSKFLQPHVRLWFTSSHLGEDVLIMKFPLSHTRLRAIVYQPCYISYSDMHLYFPPQQQFW